MNQRHSIRFPFRSLQRARNAPKSGARRAPGPAWVLAGLAIASLFAEQAQGQTTYTLGSSITSGSASWNQTTTWAGGVVASGTDNTADVSENVLVGNLTITLDGNQTIGNLTLGDAGATYNTAIATGNGGTLTFSTSGSTPQIDVVNGSNTISVVIAGTQGLDISGAGTLTLSAANTYSGITQISGGTLVLGNSLALQNSVLDYNSYGGSLSFGMLTAATIGGLQGGQNLALTNESSGGVTLTVAEGASTNSYNGVLSGSGGLTVTGLPISTTGTLNLSNALTLANANTYTGATTISEGGLLLDFSQGLTTSNIISSASALTFLNGGQLTIFGSSSGAISQTFNGLTIGAGAATLDVTFNGGNTLITLGSITRSAGGTVDFDQPTGTQSSANGFVTTTANGSGGILGGWATVNGTDWAVNIGTNIVALGTYTNDTWGTAGTSNVTVTKNDTVSNGAKANSLRFGGTLADANRTVTVSGTATLTTGGILVSDNFGGFSATITGGTLLSGSSEIIVNQDNAAGSLTIKSVIADNGSPTGLTKSGQGNLILSSQNTYTGPTYINDGILTLNVASTGNAIGSSSNVIIDGGILAGATTTGKDTIGGLTLINGSITDVAVITVGGTAPVLVENGSISSALASTSAIGLTKTTTGTVTLLKALTLTGPISVKNGTLVLAAANALNNTGNVVTLGDGTASPNAAGVIDLDGTAQTFPGLFSSGNGTNIITNSGAAAVTLSLTANSAFGGVIQDGAGGISFVKSNPITVALYGANTYTGSTTSYNGTLILAGGDNRLFTGGTLYLGNGTNAASSTLQLGNSNASVVSGATVPMSASNQTLSYLGLTANGTSLGTANKVVGGYSTVSTLTLNIAAGVNDVFGGEFGGTGTNQNNLAFVKTGLGTFTLGSTIGTTSEVSAFTGGTTILQGTLAIGVANALPSAGPVTISGGALDLAGFSDAVGAVTLTSGSILSSGAVVGTLTSNDAVTGFAVQSGSINAILAGSAALTKTGSGQVILNQANIYTGATNVNAGTLTLGAANALPSASAITVNGGALDLSGFSDATGPVTLVSGSIVNSGAAATLTAPSYSVQSGVISAALGGAASSLTKTGSGTVTLSGANTYSGATLITQGTLSVNPAQSGGGSFTVNDGATLGITLTAPGQTLNVSDLTLGSSTGATFNLDIDNFGTPAAPIINSTGALTLNGVTTVNLQAGGLHVGEEFPLIKYTGSIQGGGSLALGSQVARLIVNFDATSVPSEILLDVTGYDVPVWTGAVNNNWDLTDGLGTVGTQNWKLQTGGTPTTYFQGGAGTSIGIDSVIFDDTAGAAHTTVNLTTTLAPESVTVVDASLNYTFTGPGKLSGTTGILKEGTGTLTFANTGANDYTGAIEIYSGTLQLGDGVTVGAGNLGPGNVVLQAGGTLAFNHPAGDNFSVANIIGGAGTIIQEGADVVTLNGNGSAFTGQFTVSSGVLKIGSVTALGTATGLVGSGGSLDITGYSVANAITFSGGTVLASSGSGSALNGGVTLSGNGIYGNVAAGATLTISGPVAGTGAFEKDGAGVLALSGSDSFSGAFNIAAGTLQLGGSAALGLANPVTIQSGATLDLAGNSVGVPVTINGGTLRSSVGIGGGDSAAITIPTSGNIDVASASSLTLSGAITGAGGLTKTGVGVLVLSGANGYTGGSTVNAGALEFQTTASVPSAGSITLASGTVLAAGYAADQNLINSLSFTINPATLALTVNDANDLNFGFVLGGSSGQPGLSLGALGAANVTYSGNLTPYSTNYYLGGGGGTLTFASAITGSYNVVIGSSGPGTVILTGANTYTGSTTIDAGTLMVGSASALGLGSSLVLSGGVVDLNGYNVTLQGLSASAGVITDNSATTGATTLTVDIVSGSFTFTGSIEDGPNRKIALDKTGAGTLVINRGNGQTYTGGTILDSGVLDLRVNNAQVLPLNSNITFTNSAELLLSNNGTGSGKLTLGGLTLSGGLASLVNNKTSTGASAAITFSGAISRQPGAAANLTLGNGATWTSSTTGYNYYLTSATVTPNAFINPGLYYQGNDFAVADATNGYVRALSYGSDANTANVALSASQTTLATAFGNTVTGTDLQLSGAGSISDQTSETLNSLKIAGANGITLDSTTATLTVTSGGILKAGGSAAVISGGAGITVGAGKDLVLRAAAATDVLNIATSIQSTVTGGVTVSGLGIVELSGKNAYTGPTAILQGILQIGASANALGAATNPVVAEASGSLDVNSFAVANPITLNGGGITNSSATAPGIFAGNVTLSASGGVLSAATGAALNVSGVVSGSGLLTVTATGIAELSGANTFSGNVTMTNGTLDITNSAALGIGPKTISIASGNRPSLTLDGSGGAITLDSTLGFVLSSDGTVNTTGGIINLAGNNTINGQIDLTNSGGGNGRIQSNGGTLTLAGAINANGATGVRTLLLGGTANGVISGLIADGLSNGTLEQVSISKDGTGIWQLTGANTFSGSTTILAGTLQVADIELSGTAQPLGGGVAALAFGGGTPATAGTLEYSGSVATTLDRALTTAGLGGAIKNSSGALLTYSGTGTLGAGPLTLAGGAFNVTGQFTGSGGLTVNNATVTVSSNTSNYTGSTTIIGGGKVTDAVANGLSTASALTLGEATGNTGGVLDLNGFDQGVAGLSSAGTGVNTVTNGGASGTNTLTVSGSGTFAGAIKDGSHAAIAVSKTNTGNLTLSGQNTYSGATTVNGGSLIVSGSMSGTVNVAVNSGGTLGGNGWISTALGGSVTVASGGTLAPTAAGASGLSIDAGTGATALNLQSGSTLSLSVAHSNSGSGAPLLTDYSWVNLDKAGAVTLAGALTIVETGAVSHGDLFAVILNSGGGTVTGSFSNTTILSAATYFYTDASGQQWEVNTQYDGSLSQTASGIDYGAFAAIKGGNEVAILAVPEPASGASLLGGLSVLLGLQRFRRRARGA